MTKSKRRGPRKIGRTRKARSRRYGGMQPADAGADAAGADAAGADAAGAGAVTGAAGAALNATPASVSGSNVSLSDRTELQTEYAKIQGPSYYTMFGSLARDMSVNDGIKDPYSIVALLYLIKYHISDTKDNIQAEFAQTVTKMKGMTKSKSDQIKGAVDAIAGRAHFGDITQDNKGDLLAYVNEILGELNA